jgi:hypothetical protein
LSALGPTREVSIAIGPSVNALRLFAIGDGMEEGGLNDLAKLKKFPSTLDRGMGW